MKQDAWGKRERYRTEERVDVRKKEAHASLRGCRVGSLLGCRCWFEEFVGCMYTAIVKNRKWVVSEVAGGGSLRRKTDRGARTVTLLESKELTVTDTAGLVVVLLGDERAGGGRRVGWRTFLVRAKVVLVALVVKVGPAGAKLEVLLVLGRWREVDAAGRCRGWDRLGSSDLLLLPDAGLVVAAEGNA